MSVWRKLATLCRASVREPAEKLVDANDLRIFAQEVRQAEQAMFNARRELAALMAESKQLGHSMAQRQALILQRESQARLALEKQEEALALELADQVAADENLLAERRQQAERMAEQEKQLRKQMRLAANSIQHYRRELSLARANQSAEQVLRQLNGHTNGLNAHLGDLQVSLDRIRERQTQFLAMDEALRELDAEASGASLDQRLRHAGIETGEHSGRQVLERIRNDNGSQRLAG